MSGLNAVNQNDLNVSVTSYHSDLPLSSPTVRLIEHEDKSTPDGDTNGQQEVQQKTTRIGSILERINAATSRRTKDKTKYDKHVNVEENDQEESEPITTTVGVSVSENETSQFAVIHVHKRNYGTFPPSEIVSFLADEKETVKSVTSLSNVYPYPKQPVIDTEQYDPV